MFKKALAITLIVLLVCPVYLSVHAAPQIISEIGMSIRENGKTETTINYTLHIDTTIGYGFSDFGTKWFQDGTEIGSKSWMIFPGMEVSGADFTATIQNLVPGTVYRVCGYVVQYGQVFLSDSFTTATDGTNPNPTQEPTPMPTTPPASTKPTQKPTATPTQKPGENVTKINTPLKTIYIQTGKSFTIPYVTYSEGNPGKAELTWKTSNGAIATVSKTGVVSIPKKVKKGSATITGVSDNGKKLTVKVNVAQKALAVKSATVKAPASMKVGETYQITVKPSPAKATGVKVTFKSSKPGALFVDAAGGLKAIKKGKYTVTVKVGVKSVKKTIIVK